MITTLHIYLLGDFLLVSGETPVTTVALPRVQSLLTYLVLHRNAPQDRSHLAFLLWPDSTEAQAHTNLRQLLHHLRKSLPQADQFISANKQSLQWLPAHADSTFTLDIQEMELALVQAEQAEQAQDMVALRQALEQVLHLYRGDLLPNCYEEWVLPERDRLRQAFLQAAERLITLLEEERAYAAAITVAQRLLRQDPLHEATYRQLMRLHALRDDRAAALRAYHTCARLLERDLGTEPSEITRTIYESLVQSNSSPGVQAGPHTKRSTQAPLVGRQTEWRQLQAAWRKAASGHPHIMILTGEAGIGKTRMAEEMEAWVDRQGMTTMSTRCYTALGHLAYAPITAWLRSEALQTSLSALDPTFLTEIARLVPEVLATRPKLPRPTAMTEGWQRQRFFEALARSVLSARQPLLLLLDDLQWCDQETLEWLHYLLRFEPGARVLFIGTVRVEETSVDHPLVTFLGALQRDGLVTEVPLGPLTTLETTSLAEHIMGHHLDTEVSNTLYAQTEGNPLFVVEMIQAKTSGQCGSEPPTAKGPSPLLTRQTSTLPPMVQSVLATRLVQLSPSARDIANVAAVIGREFVFSVLARASGEREETAVRGLDELWQRRIVREQGAGTSETYDFSHDKLREHIYASLSPAYQRLLHRRVAEALKAVHIENLDAVNGQIAAHYEHANLPDQAIPYYQQAGKVAHRLYAKAEAIHAFKRAVALLETHTSVQVSWEVAAQIHEALGDVSLEIGRSQEARHAYEQAMTHIPAQEPLRQARLHRKVASTWNHASINPQDNVSINARQAIQEAECLLEQVSDPADPAWRDEWVALQFTQIWPLRGSIGSITTAIEKARPVIEQYGTKEQRELLFFAAAMRDLIQGRYMASERGVASLRNAVTAIQQTGDQDSLGTLLFALGLSLLWSDQPDEAEERLVEALHVGERIGLAWLQTRSLTYLPFIYRRRGQIEQVRNVLTRAQAQGMLQNNSILTGHRAWIAWREGNLVEAETYGRTSVEEMQQQQDINAFHWVGVWPLLGVALAREKITDVINYVRILLDPVQQPPQEQVKTLLEEMLQAWDAEQMEQVRDLLQQAMHLAEQIGYL